MEAYLSVGGLVVSGYMITTGKCQVGLSTDLKDRQVFVNADSARVLSEFLPKGLAYEVKEID